MSNRPFKIVQKLRPGTVNVNKEWLQFLAGENELPKININMAVLFWHLVKSDASVHDCIYTQAGIQVHPYNVQITYYQSFLQCTRKIHPCITSHSAYCFFYVGYPMDAAAD